MKKMKFALPLIAVGVALMTFVALSFRNNSKEQIFVILSTNDMHSQIDKFPAMATAIEACRDTVDVVLVDAGDRCTGNAFVDLVDLYAPMYELMNKLDYDVAVYGNHEFDKGQANLARVDAQASFPILGANIKSNTAQFPQPIGHHIVEVGGKKIAFVGVVSNYDNGHPSGKAESYEGLEFVNPHTTAAEWAHLRQDCDMLVMLSHCGLERDEEFAASEYSKGYDMVVSAHSHDMANEVINGVLVSQTGSRLKNIGATTVTIAADGSVKLSHRNVPISNYEPDAEFAAMVEGYYQNPELNAKIGTAAADFSDVALRNLFAETIRKRTNSNIGLYHSGGVRIEQMKAGDISLATVLNAEPFGSTIATAKMSVDELKELIMTKFNDKQNLSEAHYIDLVTTVPYTVITDAESGDAVDIDFPTLTTKRIYTVAMGDYIYKSYRGLKCREGKISDILITDVLRDFITSTKAITPDIANYQSIVIKADEE